MKFFTAFYVIALTLFFTSGNSFAKELPMQSEGVKSIDSLPIIASCPQDANKLCMNISPTSCKTSTGKDGWCTQAAGGCLCSPARVILPFLDPKAVEEAIYLYEQNNK